MNLDFIFMMGALFLVQKIDFKDPNNVFYAVAAFGTVQLICLCAYFMIYNKIKARPKSTNLLTIKTPASFGQEEKTEKMTIEDYDLSQIKKVAGNIAVGICVPLFLLYKWNIVPPLAINCVMAFQNLYKNKLFKIYILGDDDTKHPRPFVDESPFAGLMQGFQPPAEQPETDTAGNIRIPATTENTQTTTTLTDRKSKKKETKKKIVEVNSDDEVISDDEKETKKSLRRKVD